SQSQITHSLSLVTHSLDAPRLLGHPLPHPAPPRRGNWAMAMSMSAATRAMRRIHARRTSASCLLRSARPDPNPAVLQGQAPVPRWYWGAAAGADPPSTQAHLGVATVPQRQVFVVERFCQYHKILPTRVHFLVPVLFLCY
uniref:Uncharacterized protein n=6 Tax=Aegilops tauschii subsp. strangulata TaxID=200361 RepID=A0A452YA00_AEGTS